MSLLAEGLNQKSSSLLPMLVICKAFQINVIPKEPQDVYCLGKFCCILAAEETLRYCDACKKCIVLAVSDVFFYGKLTGVAQGMRKEGLAACKSVVVVLVVFFLLLSVLCFSSFPRSYCNYLFFYFFIAHSPLHIFCWSKKKRCQSGLNMDL